MHVFAMRAALLGLVLGAAAVSSPAPAGAQSPVPMKLTVTVGGRTDTLRGTGRCAHEPHASIYGTAAALWLAEYSGAGADGRTVALSYWRPVAPGAAEQFSLSVGGKAAAHRISTVKGGRLEGSGRATFRPTALGGRFEIAGKAQDGASLQATIECARFGGISAEGG